MCIRSDSRERTALTFLARLRRFRLVINQRGQDRCNASCLATSSGSLRDGRVATNARARSTGEILKDEQCDEFAEQGVRSFLQESNDAYDCRIVAAGSILMARTAGTQHASTATTRITSTTMVYVIG